MSTSIESKHVIQYFNNPVKSSILLFRILQSLPFIGSRDWNSNSKHHRFTFLWMTKRQHWIRGPNWPKKFAHPTEFCSCALNSSSVVFTRIDEEWLHPSFNVIFDYDHNKWIEIPSIDNNRLASNSIPYTCASAVSFGKNTSQLMVLSGYLGKYRAVLILFCTA